MNCIDTARVAARAPAPSFTLRIGREKFQVDSLTHASILYQDLRDASGCGASEWPAGRIEIDGVEFFISYNGRVWRGKLGGSLEMEAC